MARELLKGLRRFTKKVNFSPKKVKKSGKTCEEGLKIFFLPKKSICGGQFCHKNAKQAVFDRSRQNIEIFAFADEINH